METSGENYVSCLSNQLFFNKSRFWFNVCNYSAKLKMINWRQNYTIAIGGNISLHCEASGYPLPIVYWKHGDEILLSGLGRVSLSFVNASASATGVYTCIANSMYHDEISRSTFLSVNPPHVHMRPTTPFHGMFLRA